MSRVLKQGGRIAFSDLQEHSHEWLRKEHADLWLGFNMEDIAVMLKDNGLEKVSVDALSSCCSSTQSEQAMKIPMFLASGQKRD
jgi:ubiquinone/menaquinone biosynthesis C-methylase UbiE